MNPRGRLVWLDLGAGAWALEAEDGVTYTLEGEVSKALVGRAVEVEGALVPDAAGFAMSGPVLRVKRMWPAR